MERKIKEMDKIDPSYFDSFQHGHFRMTKLSERCSFLGMEDLDVSMGF